MLANPLYIFALALVAAVGVSAQTADACVLACVQEGLANSTCTSLYVVMARLPFLYLFLHRFRSTDLSCVCNSTSFKATAASCLTANCTAADQQAALQLEQQECGSMYHPVNTLYHCVPLTRLLSVVF